MDKQLISNLLIYCLPILFAITLHEASHAYIANYFGDSTAKNLGRLTLNPVSHIDVFGTIILPLGMYLMSNGSMLFGYAKPVPVNTFNFKKPRTDMMWIALAGPISNLIQAMFWLIFFILLTKLNIKEVFFLKMAQGGILVNLLLFIFNLLPLPPLDGGRVLAGLLPRHLANQFERIEPYGFFIVIGLAFTGILYKVWISPLLSISYKIFIELPARLFI